MLLAPLLPPRRRSLGCGGRASSRHDGQNQTTHGADSKLPRADTSLSRAAYGCLNIDIHFVTLEGNELIFPARLFVEMPTFDCVTPSNILTSDYVFPPVLSTRKEASLESNDFCTATEVLMFVLGRLAGPR